MDIFEEIVRLRREGRRAALATIVHVNGSIPSFESSRMLVREDGSIAGTIGGGCVEAEVWAAAKEAMRTERPRTLSFNLNNDANYDTGLICGGTLEIFVEPILPKPQLCLFGGGHVSLALARIADQAGFEITVVDDRESFANLQRFPMAAGVHTSFEASFEKLHPNPSTYVVIVTRGHKDDMRVLKWAVGTDARYIGMIGSKRKVIFARVHATIGLDIGAQTPEEIAVSIVAELIAERRQAAGSIHHKTVQVAGKAASTAASD
jgi:xanthine dehydrogenase accessory factor